MLYIKYMVLSQIMTTREISIIFMMHIDVLMMRRKFQLILIKFNFFYEFKETCKYGEVPLL